MEKSIFSTLCVSADKFIYSASNLWKEKNDYFLQILEFIFLFFLFWLAD